MPKQGELKMRKRISLLSALFLFFLFGLASPTHAANESSSDTGSQANNFMVQPILPKSQISKKITYYDLQLEPNQTEKLSIKVINTGSKRSTITVGANNAYTSDNGVIAYDQTQKPLLNNAQPSLATMVQGKRTQKVTLDPGKIETVTFKIKMPAKKYNGIVLGGIQAVGEADKSGKNTIKNRIAYVVGVVLQNSQTHVSPNAKISDAKPMYRNLTQGVQVHMANNRSINISKMRVESHLYLNKKQVKKFTQSGLQMAPHSSFNYFIPKSNLKPGKYELKMLVTGADGFQKKLSTQFSVSEKEAKATAQPRVVNRSNSNLWLWITIGVLVVLIIGGLAVWNFYRSANKAGK